MHHSVHLLNSKLIFAKQSSTHKSTVARYTTRDIEFHLKADCSKMSTVVISFISLAYVSIINENCFNLATHSHSNSIIFTGSHWRTGWWLNGIEYHTIFCLCNNLQTKSVSSQHTSPRAQVVYCTLSKCGVMFNGEWWWWCEYAGEKRDIQSLNVIRLSSLYGTSLIESLNRLQAV